MPPPGARRTRASEETRTRILEAARDLAVAEGFARFTVERVAERAGVSRLTVYYQFGSKSELVEALFDHLAARGRMDRLQEAFREPDALAGLARFIEVFCGFWASDTEAIRRLRSWSALESGGGTGAERRDAWQLQGLEMLVGRIQVQYGVPAQEAVPEVVDVLHALLSPESYEKLARGGRTPAQVAALVMGAARAILGVPG